MLNLKHNLKLTALLSGMLLPVCAFAASEVGDALQNVGQEVSNAATAVSSAASDAAITAKVKALLAVEPDISMKISVTTNNGIVDLSGLVDTSLQADKAVEVAKGVDGVKRVNASGLKVVSSDSYFSDAMCTVKAKAKISSLASDKKIAKGYDLHVETTNGEVHIFGTVTNKADIDTVRDAVRAIADVKGVKTNIDVKK